MNGNSNGLTQVKRMEMEFKGHSYLFSINPEQYEIKLQNRLNLVYTKMGAFIDLFGEGVKEITVSGITGYKGVEKDNNHGYEKFVELKKLIEDNFNDIEDGKEVTDFLMFYNHTDGEGYVTVPVRLSIYRNVNQPLLYKYDLMLYAIRKAGEPAPTNESQVIGNPLGTPTTGSETVKNRDLVEKPLVDTSFTEENIKKTGTVLGIRYNNVDSRGNVKEQSNSYGKF